MTAVNPQPDNEKPSEGNLDWLSNFERKVVYGLRALNGPTEVLAGFLKGWSKAAFVAAIPVFLAGMNLYRLSWGDPQGVASLLPYLNVTSTLFGVVLELLPQVCTLIPLSLMVAPVVRLDDKGTWGRRSYNLFFKPAALRRALLAWGLITLFLPARISLASLFFLTVASIALKVTDRLLLERTFARLEASHSSEELEDEELLEKLFIKAISDSFLEYSDIVLSKTLRSTLFLFGVLLCTSYALTSKPPFPHELVLVQGDEKYQSGYVINVDDVSMSFIYSGGGYRRIPNGEIRERVLCPSGSPVFWKRESDRFMGRLHRPMPVLLVTIFKTPYVAPQCNLSSERIRES